MKALKKCRDKLECLIFEMLLIEITKVRNWTHKTILSARNFLGECSHVKLANLLSHIISAMNMPCRYFYLFKEEDDMKCPNVMLLQFSFLNFYPDLWRDVRETPFQQFKTKF